MPFHPFRTIKRGLPRGLFGRSLIIIVTPMVLLQAIVTYAFFERHYDIVTRHMAENVAADVAFLVGIEEAYPPGPERTHLLQMATRALNYQISLLPGEHVAKLSRHEQIDTALNADFTEQLGG